MFGGELRKVHATLWTTTGCIGNADKASIKRTILEPVVRMQENSRRILKSQPQAGQALVRGHMTESNGPRRVEMDGEREVGHGVQIVV